MSIEDNSTPEEEWTAYPVPLLSRLSPLTRLSHVMRTSCDQYMHEGQIINVSPSDEAPEGSTLWNGYDYTKQYWVFEGKRDTRTLEELQATLKNGTDKD
jgi:hypothetical protein